MKSIEQTKNKRILSLAFASRRMGFVVACGSEGLIDWGVKDIPATDLKFSLKKVQKLIDRYQPDHIYIQDIKDPNCKLGKSIRLILTELKMQIDKLNICLQVVSKTDVWNNLDLRYGTNKKIVCDNILPQFKKLVLNTSYSQKLSTCEQRNTLISIAACFLQ